MFSHLPKYIAYVRHPQCLHNVDYEGALVKGIPTQLSPLTEKGEMQAALTATYLKEAVGPFDRVFASHFLRTHTIPQAAGFDFEIDERIGERWHGELNERGNIFFQENPEQERQYKESYYHYCAPGGESCPDVEERLRLFLADVELFVDCQRILISGHGISGLMLRKILTGASEADWDFWFQFERLRNASVTVYEMEQSKYNIALYNHLPWLNQLGEVGGVEA